MNTAYRKDVRRTVAGHKKRFFSLLIITTLGVAMFTGLQASCRDLRLSADALFDGQKLFDIRVQSTLGLTGEDVAALAALDGLEQALAAAGCTMADVLFFNPIHLPWIIPGTPGHTHNNVPGCWVTFWRSSNGNFRKCFPATVRAAGCRPNTASGFRMTNAGRSARRCSRSSVCRNLWNCQNAFTDSGCTAVPMRSISSLRSARFRIFMDSTGLHLSAGMSRWSICSAVPADRSRCGDD